MPSSMFYIGEAGSAAARASLDVTSQNIANVNNPDYARRSLSVRESVSVSNTDRGVLNGVRIEGTVRSDSVVVQQQARTSASELERADTELNALRNTEIALEESGVFEALVEFEAVLTELEGNPQEPALRTNTVETARQLASAIQTADTTLATERDQVQQSATISLEEANRQAAELARINEELATAQPKTVGQAALLDARDAALRSLSQEVGVSTTFDEKGAVTVRVADQSGNPGPLLVDGFESSALTSTANADGTLAFDVEGLTVDPSRGALAGQAAALEAQARFQIELDAIATQTIAIGNTAQASGADADGNPGQPLFTGTGASDIELALTSGSQLATAPAGSPPGSTNTSNLSGLIASLGADDGPIAKTDTLLLELSSRISAQATTRNGLAAVADSAQAALIAETGVDLDAETADLVRLQQVFEANSRVMQVATEIFDTLLGLG